MWFLLSYKNYFYILNIAEKNPKYIIAKDCLLTGMDSKSIPVFYSNRINHIDLIVYIDLVLFILILH